MHAKRKDEPQLGQWIFTGLLLLFLLGVFIAGPDQLPPYKQPILTLLAAAFAGTADQNHPAGHPVTLKLRENR